MKGLQFLLKVRSDKQQALILDRESYRPLGGIRAGAGGTDGVTAQEIAIGEEERLIVSIALLPAQKRISMTERRQYRAC